MPSALTISAGKLRHRITMEQLTQSADSQTNEPVETWTPRETVWASIEPVSGNERYSSMQIQSDITHMVTIRAISGLTGQWRVRHEGRVFHIAEPPINVDERGKKMLLLCKERADS